MNRMRVLALTAGLAVAGALVWALLIRVVVPAIQGSGIPQALGEAALLRQRLIDSGYVRDASVTVGQSTGSAGQVRLLKVTVTWKGEPDSKELAATRIAGLVIESYARLDEIDRLEIGLNDPIGFGPISVNRTAGWVRSPSEWETIVAKGPDGPRAPPAPEVGASVLEDPLRLPGVFRAGACATTNGGQNALRFLDDGLLLRVAGRCRTDALVADSVGGLSLADGDVRIELRPADGADLGAIRLWIRFTPGTGGYFAYAEPGAARLSLICWADGKFTTIAHRVLAPGSLLPSGTWSALGIRARGQRLWVLADDQPMLSARDATFGSGTTSIALQRTVDPDDPRPVGYVFRNLRVSALADAPRDRVPSYQAP
jgi:hypothetical protein